MEREKKVDESWKESAAAEKKQVNDAPEATEAVANTDAEASTGTPADANPLEVNFINYVTSLAFQALIFLGQIPNPMADNKIESNPAQAKFLIDTLVLLREKTKGNLTKEEDELLSSSVYELQMKYVEISQKETKND